MFLTSCLLVLSIAVLANGECPTGWKIFGDYCYHYHDVTYATSGMSWNDSRLACQRYGADLLTIKNQAEFQFLSGNLTAAQKRQHYWIGLTDIAKEGTYVWIDGTSVAATGSHWRTASGEPNNWGGNEDCAEMHFDGKWNDNGCFREFAFICKKNKSTPIPPSPTLPPRPSSSPITCEAGWQGFNNSCYMFARESKTWAEGRSDCQARGGDLVVVDGQEEHNYLTNQAKRDRQGFWIGLSDKYTEGNFFWVDEKGLNSSRAFWATNEPSNAFGGEDCVEMYVWWNRGVWNDNKCTTKRYFICEKKAGKSMCPEGWIAYNGTCYQINAHPEQKKTWLQADAACRSFGEGANLVSIHNTAIKKKMTQEFHKVFTRNGFFWHGLNDDATEGTFVWSDTSKYDYTNWGFNELKKNTEALNCVKSELRSVNGGWSLASCNSTIERNYYVCARKRGYDRCHNPLGMEDFNIGSDQITASSQKSQTTPAYSGRRNAVKGFGLDGAWCAATNDRNQWMRIDLGEYYSVGYIGLQGHPGTSAYVKQFYLKYSPDGLRWSVYGYNPPKQSYKSLPGNTADDRSRGAVAELSPPVKARYVEIHPTVYEKAICMRVEVYGCPAVAESTKCGAGWQNNTALNTCYKVGMTALPWTAARANCLLEDGDLLSITSYNEYRFIQQTLYPLRLKTYSFWIGLNSRDAKYKYRWSDGAAFSTAQWYSGSPSSSRYQEYRCVALRTYYNAWYNTDCASTRPYVCKKKLRSSSDPQEKYTGNWISKTDQYWPLNEVNDGLIAGSRSGNAFGTFTSAYTPAGRQYLSFNGQNSYVKIPGLTQTCISNPSRCPNGLTFSMMLNLDASLSRTNGKVYILDTLGQGFTDALGSYVYVDNGQVGVFMRSIYHSWHSIITPVLGKWVHVVIVWNQQNGLTIYRNGENVVTDNSGTRLSTSGHVERVGDLYIGKAASSQKFTKFQMMSLAVWQRALSSDEVNDVYFAEMGSCKIGWVPFGQYCYQFNTNPSAYAKAKQDCELKAGNLATVSTSLQQAFLSIGIGSAGVNLDSFIGLNSMRRRRFFEFTDGSPMLFSYWTSNKPSSYSWRRYDAVVMNRNYYGRWSDLSYYYSRGYVCQRKKAILTSTPATSTGNINKTVSQYQSMTYGCPLGTKLTILSATFGKAPGCPYRNVLAKVLSICAGKRMTCQVYVSTTSFNNSCAGTRKEMKTNYKCVKDDSFTGSTGCDANWSAMPGSSYCYKFNQQKKNWTDADKYCKSKGAQLVAIQSRWEELYMTTMLINSYELTNLWIGLNDLALRGSYKWSDKSFVAYTNWYNGQPDDASRRGSCVKASLNQGYRDFVSWTDDDCSTKNAFVCKKLKASATTPTPAMTIVSNSSCLYGWFRYKSNCYQVSKTALAWNNAKSVCLRQKATLATIHSLDENEALFNFLVNTSLESAWIGMNDKGIFRGQQWVDGSSVNFVRWDSKQPDSNLGQQACTVMASNGYWRDNDCAMLRNYICKASIGKATVVPTTKKLTPPVTPTANLKYCTRGWVWSPATRNCYYFSNRTQSLSWFMARTFCRSNGGDLVSIVGSGEQNYLEPFALTFPKKEAWIGLSDLSNEAGWEWSDGRPAKYFNWNRGQPDDWDGMEDCVTIGSSGLWNDDHCGDKKSFICKRQNNLSPAPNTVAPTAGAPKGYCQPGWVHYRSKCFKLNDKEALTWTSARNVCREEIVDGRRGDLASIHSAAENSFLFSQMKGMLTRTLYIGFNDVQVEGKFRWSDQSEVSYTKWYSRQPDNYWGREDCTEMYPFGVHKGKWNDIQCSTELGYICEKDASSKPYPTNPTTAPANDSCPSGYLKYAKNCYSFKKQPLTWDDAVKFCRKENTNSDLVSIHDLYDAAYVFSHMSEFTNRFWTGLHRPLNNSKFRWSDNHPLDYTQWSAYPARRMLHLRSCVHAYYSKSSPGYWVDGNCTAKLPFACKIGREDKEVVPEHPGNCESGWLKFDKYCYLVSNSYYGTKVWSDARQRCRDKGAELASVHSIEEQNFLYKAVSKGKKSVWIGMNDRRIEKHMVWSDGTPYDYDNWNTNEPNDNAGSENCIEMIFMTGRWNDIRCSSYMGYICKKELGCDSAFGMAKDKKNITDDRISASSVYGTNFAQNARLNSRSAWCATTLDQKQYIQVDFVEKKRLTRISTQGWSRNYVLSYQLMYSDDGNSWSTYRIEGRNAILPGNRASYTTEGATLDPPVSARFIRINPLTWKYRICLRLEFYGCSYVCDQPLGMESRAIRNAEIKASSEEDNQKAYAGRFRNSNQQGWCAKTQNAEQWLQIHLSNSPMTVSKVATQGVTVGGNKYIVKAYKLMYSDDAVRWTTYKTYKGEIRIFSGNAYPESAVSHTLTMPFSAKYIRFMPLLWSGKICLRVEVFGCPYECNRALGVETGIVPDKAMTASTAAEKHEASLARLNKGKFNVGSWCALKNDQQQYLEFDLGAESRITAVATQGFEGDISKYVTEYRLQYSQNAKFWSTYEVKGVIQTFNGNNDARSFNVNPLTTPIRARYIRLNPRHWMQGICMRVELYGCPLKPIVYPTDAPIPKKKVFRGSVRFTESKYKEEYKNKSSKAYLMMANKIETAITKLYLDNYAFKEGFESVQVTDLKPGSVVALFVVIYLTNDNNATWPLKNAVSKGQLGDLVVDKESLQIKNVNEGSKGKSTQIVKKEGLSTGGKVALIVIFLLMIVVIVVVGLIYYFKKRGKAQFDHKSFDNPIHYNNDNYSTSGGRVENLPGQE